MINCAKLVIALSLLTSCYFNSAFATGNQLVGIFPLSNQRFDPNKDWIGYYIRDSIEAGLQSNRSFQFINLRTLIFWRDSPDFTTSNSFQNTFLISGSFQQVVDLGVIALNIRQPGSTGKHAEFHFSYAQESLGKKLNEVVLQLGKWIIPEFKLVDYRLLAGIEEDVIEDYIKLKMQLVEPDREIEIPLLLRLQDSISANSRPDMIAVLAESMIVLSQQLNKIEKETMLRKAESLLRKAVEKYRFDAELHALLAEVYFVRGAYPDWVIKTAQDAIKLDDRNDLAYILLILALDIKDTERNQYIDRMNQINPRFWERVLKEPGIFQKGLLENDFKEIADSIYLPN